MNEVVILRRRKSPDAKYTFLKKKLTRCFGVSVWAKEDEQTITFYTHHGISENDRMNYEKVINGLIDIFGHD